MPVSIHSQSALSIKSQSFFYLNNGICFGVMKWVLPILHIAFIELKRVIYCGDINDVGYVHMSRGVSINHRRGWTRDRPLGGVSFGLRCQMLPFRTTLTVIEILGADHLRRYQVVCLTRISNIIYITVLY